MDKIRDLVLVVLIVVGVGWGTVSWLETMSDGLYNSGISYPGLAEMFKNLE